jgi:hypothetical protein
MRELSPLAYPYAQAAESRFSAFFFHSSRCLVVALTFESVFASLSVYENNTASLTRISSDSGRFDFVATAIVAEVLSSLISSHTSYDES